MVAKVANYQDIRSHVHCHSSLRCYDRIFIRIVIIVICYSHIILFIVHLCRIILHRVSDTVPCLIQYDDVIISLLLRRLISQNHFVTGSGNAVNLLFKSAISFSMVY